jgi:hypothetical protein
MAEVLTAETMPQFRQALKNPTFTVYAYIGKETDKGWEVAQAAFKVVPALRIYLAPQRALLKEWCDDSTARGVIWGFDPTPRTSLLRAEVNDLFAVIDAITRAKTA